MERRTPVRRASIIHIACAANGSSPFHIRGALRSIYWVSSSIYWVLPLLHDPNASLLARNRRASLPRRISQRQGTDADILFVYTESLHELLALLCLEHLLFAVDPARGETYGMSGKHHILEYARAILESIGVVLC